MVAEKHIVERVKVDVDVESIELAEKIKSEINDFIQDEVLSIVESYFANLNLPEGLKDKVIQLDKVDLSIEASSWNTNSLQLKQEIRNEVEKQIDPIIDDLKEKNLKRELSLPESHNDIKEQDAAVYSKEERVLRSMFYFLDHGTLPWWINSAEESRELFSTDSLMSVLREQSVLAGKEFQKRRDNQDFRKRLVRQFPISVVSEMIQVSLSNDPAHRERITELVVDEIKNLRKEKASEIVNLIVELSDSRTIDEVFRKDSSSTIFNHIHSEFFGAELSENKLDLTLRSTNSVLRILYFFGGREPELTSMTPEFQKSLNTKLSSAVLASLKETKTYQKLFLSADVVQMQDAINKTSKLDAPSSKNRPATDPLESEKMQKEADADSATRAQNEKSDIEYKKESVEDEKPIDEVGDLTLQTEGEQTVTGDVLIGESEKDDIENPGRKANDQTDQVSENKDANEIEERLTGELSDQNSNDKSIENQVSSEFHNEDDLSGSVSKNNDDARTVDSNVGEKKMEELDQSSLTESSESKFESSRSDSKGKDETDTHSYSQKDSSVKKSEFDSQSEQNRNKDEINELREILKRQSEDSSRIKKSTDTMPDQLFVDNAGLVLLNPFLPALFKQLELVGEDGKLTNPDLAACILHYVATGREGDFEFEMAFEKYLCGIPPAVSLDRKIELNEKQKEEVEKVLNSVLEHWSALRSKSTELLQNEFLTRSGKLIVEKSNHRLVIEKKTFDLLLDKLPWSYSLIKFSWKKKLIFVEW